MAVREEVGLVALHEIKRNLGSLKGIVMFVLFLALGGIAAALRILGERFASRMGADQLSPEQKREAWENLLSKQYKSETIGHYLADCPAVILVVLFGGTLLFAWLFILIIGFDQISGEVQHRSIRYLVGRARRESIVIGKALGHWAIISVMMLVLHMVVWLVLLFQTGTHADQIFLWGGKMWLFCVASAAAYVGLFNLVSSWFKTPMLALLVGFCMGLGMALIRLILIVIGEKADFATWIFPATYESLYVSPDPLRAFGGVALSIAWGAALVAATVWVTRRKDL